MGVPSAGGAQNWGVWGFGHREPRGAQFGVLRGGLATQNPPNPALLSFFFSVG